MTKMPQFQWSPNRRLNNRGCVLNMFIDKQEPDEFNPDYKKIKPGEKNKDGTPKLPTPPKLEKGSYRTEGQVKVIMRFISSIADSFRPILDMQQHVVFTGARDGGHLADQALKMWPPRGKYRTKLYVIADDEDAPSMSERDHSDRALQYGPIDAIEQRFQNHKYSQYIHVFDSKGQKAGLVNSYVDDDDVAQIMEEEMFHLEDDEFGPDISSVDDDTVMDTNSLDGKVTGTDFFSLKKLMNPYLERGEDEEREFLAERLEAVNRTNHAIPYFHVDGTSQLRQFDVLQSAKPLILDKTISVVGVENTPDTDFDELIDFFHTVNMKTFLLGKSQIMRIDHLCRETLDDLIAHPNITPKRPGPIRRLLQRLKFIPPDPLAHVVHPHPNNDLLFPPFFVALPRGRTSKEEMTIQHMYDLFGGGGGGGQIATANDRKAPDKKKKKT